MPSGRKTKVHSNETWLKAWENRGLVFNVIGKMFPEIKEPEEFLYDGLHGLCLAIEKYDPSRGSLSNYSINHIHNCIYRSLMKSRMTIYVPEAKRKSVGLTPDSFVRENEDWSWDNHPDNSYRMESSNSADASDLVEDAMKILPGHIAGIIRSRFGIGCKEKTSKEIGRERGLSRQAIDYYKANGLKAMRGYITRKIGQSA